MVVFRIGEEEFALDIMMAKEVVVKRDITPVPETDDYVEGVMNLRGNLIPVLDFRRRLRARVLRREGSERIIVIIIDGKPLGLMVDSTSEVIRVNDEMIEPAPDIIGESDVRYVSGIVNLKGRFITLIDVRSALSETITHDLEHIMGLLTRSSEAVAQAEAI